MRSYYIKFALVVTLTLSFVLPAFADQTDKGKTVKQHLTPQTRIELIRLLEAELVFVRKPFPKGTKGLTLKASGEITPGALEIQALMANMGAAAKPGDRVQITNIKFTGKTIYFEINGGPKKKTKWYQRIQVGTGDAMTPISQQSPEELDSKGSSLTLEFNDYVPEITKDELRQLLLPVFDFEVKSYAQAFADTLPPLVRKAVLEHRALVGMDHDMVIAAKGRAPRKIREREGELDYEEWVYGTPPEDVEFIRFYGDEVTQVKIMKITGEKVVRTEREVPLPENVAAKNAQPQDSTPKDIQKPLGGPPSLRRPGEALPEDEQAAPPKDKKPDNKKNPPPPQLWIDAAPTPAQPVQALCNLCMKDLHW